MNTPPTIDNAPGLKWRPIKLGWQATWRARADLMTRGYAFRSMRLWQSTREEPLPNPISVEYIQLRCQVLQEEMLLWARGGIESVTYDGTWKQLVRSYQTDPDSPYHKKRYATRQHYDTLCRRVVKDCGAEFIARTDARRLMRLHESWSEGGKVSMGHAMIGMMRTLTTFGSMLLKCPGCRAIRPDMSDMRLASGNPRENFITAEQAQAIRQHAHAMKVPYRHSIAIAQAFQFDLTMRQKDCIGEWVPLSEKTPPTDVISGNSKWVRGLRWEEIDQNLILRHMTSKKQKMLAVDIKDAPMVMAELRLMTGISPATPLLREHIPASGPLLVNEQTGEPWESANFRRAWREIARAVGVPDDVFNMDSRAGAITEAFAAGADADSIRKSAKHSSLSMTARYSRGDQDAIADVLKHRVAHRNKGDE